VYPPSRIRLRESTCYASNPAHPDYEFDQHSVRYLRSIWPQIQVQFHNGMTGQVSTTISGSPAQLFVWSKEVSASAEAVGGAIGLSAEATGILNAPRGYELEGDECLVFFLGGVAEWDGTQYTLHGFTRSPTNPSGVPNTLRPESLNRDTPMFEFKADRLFSRTAFPGLVEANITAGNNWWGDFRAGTGALRPQKLPSYRALSSTNPSNPKPYAYFSSYEGSGYKPDDCNIPDSFQTEETVANFQIRFPFISTLVSGATPTGSPPTFGHVTSTGPNPLIQSSPVYPPGTALGSEVNPVTGVLRCFNDNSYQLMSPGSDGMYGGGGLITTTFIVRSGSFSDDNVTNVSGDRRLGEYSRSQSGN
jgi:hypothetical protein